MSPSNVHKFNVLFTCAFITKSIKPRGGVVTLRGNVTQVLRARANNTTVSLRFVTNGVNEH